MTISKKLWEPTKQQQNDINNDKERYYDRTLNWQKVIKPNYLVPS